ncbi:MAG: cell division protein FtsA [Armatimonadota bacterium]|nr:cell division protein FtsA [Armatimonadota bacterium]MDR7402594.1 cell division protein FtsA [Armatimonadota bacterium]MDR7404039.1 cell division protein FtsA [Armatimonadota bacterium]MDR7436804.1 cell division protein FtsA [Armatimonadota bacterium]MDR7472751.1 cell division protein FtsA [Armatimonadota bacterium]
MSRKQHVVGLDIGTTKVCAVVGEVDDDGEVHIAGVGSTPSSGIRKGVVIDLDATTRAIEEAVERAERMAGITISSLYVGVSGEHITSTNSRGVVAVSRGDHEISSADVERVIEAARMAALPASDREIVHMLPRGFVVDGHDGVRNPVGMYGSRLEVEAHIVTGTSTVLANLLKCVQRAGLELEEIVLEPLASAEAVLTPAERELGVVLADIGGGTTSIGVFVGGGLCHTAILPVGGHHITSDVAVGLRTPVAEAEKLKIRHGAASAADAREGELIEVFNVGDREPRVLPRRVLCEIIEPRLQEICGLLRLQIRRSGYAHLVPAGIVLTGGTALLRGITRYVSEHLELPARVGVPDQVGGLTDAVASPIYATGVGLVLYGVRHGGSRPSRGGNGTGLWSRVRSWWREVVHGG